MLSLGFWLGWRGADECFAELRGTVVSEADGIKAQSAARFALGEHTRSVNLANAVFTAVYG